MNIVAIIQARMSSTRLPGKVLADLGGRVVLDWVVQAAREAQLIDVVVVATSDRASDDPIDQWCIENEVNCFRGSLENVGKRYVDAAAKYRADIVVRLTADCPFLDPGLIDACILMRGANTKLWPDGMDVQVFDASILYRAHPEHVIGPDILLPQLPCPETDLRNFRVTLDTPDDLDLLLAMVPYLPRRRAPGWRETLAAAKAANPIGPAIIKYWHENACLTA